ncbi:peroxiredoxin-like family protein [Pseudofrankia asymbiotica]|uniref:Alkyl hydroperoxide reductase n=1 Tax=Pseudofrankia asymbiotica TaxID=1834516 RepID=A0A1V2IGL8_9ACTN|nr:peroxiredoxin-like family protein [Pseudofrankia asymbiotica]ONH32267.1 alkyl hydroperoxide reductase [Pseudofrankia asymbiotica]
MYTPRNPVRPGAVVTARELVPVAGPPVPVPDPAGRLVHLQFRRFAGCPICNLHLRSITRRIAEIEGAGVREVVVFHSLAAELARYADELPLTLIADPERRLYAEFGVESAARALLDPRAWGGVIRGVARSTWAVLRRRDRPPARRQPNGRLGLPGDFLIAPDGKVLAARYGEHAYDQWSVDELLALATAPRELAPAG